MRKYSLVVLSIVTLSMSALYLSSCKEEEVVKPKLSFASSEMTVNEADGVIEVELVLDKPAKEDITVEYEFDGDAYDDIRAEEEEVLADFEVVGEYGEVVIEKGETSAIIEIQLYSDFLIEDDETIEIAITDVSSSKIEITREDDIEITVGQEQDGMVVYLEWDESYTDVDMDILLRLTSIGGNVGTQPVVWGSADASTTPGESIFLPASIEDALYGLSYTYYAGTEEPMNFTVTMIEAVDGIFEAVEDRDVFQGTYTLDNINAWTGNGSTTKVVQTFENVGGAFTNFSQIVPPASGSRVGSAVTGNVPLFLKRQPKTTNVPLNLKGRLKDFNKN